MEAESGTDGLRVVQDVNGRLDLVISDILMQNGDGFSLASSVTASYPKVPLLFISGYFQQEFQGIEGAFEFLPKPFLPDALIRTVKKLISKNEQRQSQSRNWFC